MNRVRNWAVVATVTAFVLAGQWSPVSAAGPPVGVQFVDVAAQLGVDALSTSGRDIEYIVEGSIGGSAFFDYDNDGDIDLYVANGSSFDGFAPGEHPTNRLYRNEGGRFVDVTVEAGVGDTSWSLGCVAADYDNDGDTDIYIATFGRNTLYNNNGDGTFTDATVAAGVGDPGYGTGAAFGDYDRDGDLDLYVSNYIDFSIHYESTVPCVWKTLDIMCGPRGLLPQADVFYRNNGDGTFSDVTDAVGMGGKEYYGYGVIFSDLNSDGWPDVFVADDMSPNMLFMNQGDGTFSEEGLASGVGFSGDGQEQGCMGVAVGDYDGDGHFDVFITNFEGEYNVLYENQGDGFFLDASFVAGVTVRGNPEVGWGTGFFDYDNDGDEDLFVANGHTYPQADAPYTNASYRQPNFLLENDGNGRFTDISDKAGPGLAILEASRGASFADFDDDGDIDIFVLNLNSIPNLLRNDGGNANNYLFVKTTGSRSNRDGIGTRIELTAGGKTQVREVRSGASYLSHNDMKAHFGLGKAEKVDRIVLRWPSGVVQTMADVAVNQVLEAVEPK